MHHKKSHKMHQRMMHKLEKSGISEQQMAEIKVIHDSGKELREEKHQEIKALKTQVRSLAKAESLDEQALRDLLITVAEKKADLMIMHINSRQQVKSLLNDEQRAKWEEMHNRHVHHG
jgi:Spy/CpxP family protein refolding chaperone